MGMVSIYEFDTRLTRLLKFALEDIEEAFKTRFAYVLSSEFPNDPQIYTRTCLQGVLHLTGLKCILP
jgi:abortive infection bacteriophage resistance protein